MQPFKFTSQTRLTFLFQAISSARDIKATDANFIITLNAFGLMWIIWTYVFNFNNTIVA